MCRNTLQTDWLIQPRSRQLVAGHVIVTETSAPHDWLMEPSQLVVQRDAILVARTLCQHGLLKELVHVEIYNPSDEPIRLYS